MLPRLTRACRPSRQGGGRGVGAGRRPDPATSMVGVPPQGYLEVESRHSPTSPRALRTLARAAVKAGLCWDPGNPLPVQRFVEAQERARLVFCPTGAAESHGGGQPGDAGRHCLAKAEEAAAAVATVRPRQPSRSRAIDQIINRCVCPLMAADDRGGQLWAAIRYRCRPEQPARLPMLDRWSEAAILVVIAGGQAVLAYTAARDGGSGWSRSGRSRWRRQSGPSSPPSSPPGIHQLGATAEGSPIPSGGASWT